MATAPKPTQSAAKMPAMASAPAVKPAPARSTNAEKQAPGQQTFLFDRENYIWMFAGLALMLIGMLLMAGGKSKNPAEFNYDEIYSLRRITIAPLILLTGIGLEIYAIMKRPKAKQAA
jgi:predicted cobalt transporter CbtA